MIDLHTHILPCMDDGSKSPEMSIQMLKMEVEQGVDTVVLTPHFYRNKEESSSFFKRRAKCFDMLREAIDNQDMELPQLILGAEVACMPNMSNWSDIDKLRIGDTNYLLLEMPFYPWTDQIMQQLYDIVNLGITPVFAHLERYKKSQKKEYINAIVDMGTPIQVSSAPLLHFNERRPIVKMIKSQQAHLMASDCHNITTRPPNLGEGLAVVERLLGADIADALKRNARAIATDTAE